jgi:uncharacterized protein YcbX
VLENRRELNEWFSDFFGFRVHIKRNTETGFPDDTKSPGPTVIGSATLSEVTSWFELLDYEELSCRFRANIEIATDVAFWEDRLFGSFNEQVEFRIGQVILQGVNPCQRCVVPSRHSVTGVATEDFQRVFTAKRAATLPQWTIRSRFSHYYRLSVNTWVPRSEVGKFLRVGDQVWV